MTDSVFDSTPIMTLFVFPVIYPVRLAKPLFSTWGMKAKEF